MYQVESVVKTKLFLDPAKNNHSLNKSGFFIYKALKLSLDIDNQLEQTKMLFFSHEKVGHEFS
ncbi:hypothetical protein J522_1952 [Acinetobacter baumannii 146457]|nr:hypothetical protein J522_1952 [Acinetobacter baumannii 146457]